MPLLGLEPANTEKTGFISVLVEDSNQSHCYAPLLGTITLKSLNKSSNGRSTQRVCNDLLLRFGAHSSGLSSGKTVRNGPRGCYGFSPGFMPRGMTLRGDRYYLRRHIPSDIQPIVGRSEVWRSLKTDSLQTALRRLPLVTAALESEFERIRDEAGLSVDQTLLRPCEDDLARSVSELESEQPETGIGAIVTLGEAYTRYIDEACCNVLFRSPATEGTALLLSSIINPLFEPFVFDTPRTNVAFPTRVTTLHVTEPRFFHNSHISSVA